MPKFESFVNSEECKTGMNKAMQGIGLRALLIQKSVKRVIFIHVVKYSLRALLIQKSVKQKGVWFLKKLV